ncbi:MAG: DUF5071 domain-containing protein [Gammaproteobacteria bacterium]
MDAKSLKRLLPRDKDDAETARALVALGSPVLEPVLPQMLEWLKSNGSPVEVVVRDFFAALGVHAVPVVEKALASRHDGLKYSVVMNVVAKWPPQAIAPLKVQLQALATGSGVYGTDLVALRLLTEHRLADPAWLKEWAQFKTNRLREFLSQAEHIDGLLAK